MKKRRHQPQSRKRASKKAAARKPVPTRTIGRRKRRQGIRHRAPIRPLATKVSQVVGAMRREHLSLAQAAKRVGVSPKVIVRESGSSLRKLSNGRYVARATDRLLRVVRIPTTDGIRDVSLRNSKDASLIGDYWNAVHAYLAKGDVSELERFRGLVITTADRERVALLTDRAALDQLGSAGVLSFESMYAKVV